MVRISRNLVEQSAPGKPGVVLPFPGPLKGEGSPVPGERAKLPESPQHGERTIVQTSALQEWLRAALIVSVVVHVIIYAAFNLRFEGDLERAAGAAASAASEGTITIPVEVVIESILPSAPAPTDASAADAEQLTPTPPVDQVENSPTEPDLSKIVSLMPPPPEPAPVVIPEPKLDMPPPPEPAPVVLRSAKEAARFALPEEAIAVPMPVERADAPEASVEQKEEQSRPPATKQVARPPAPQKSAPSRAAGPSRAAASNGAGSAGAGGETETGGRAAISSYFARVQTHLSRQAYPPEARANGISGIVRVVFSLGRDGRVLSVSLAQGSGQGVLDQAALAMVRRAAPFPPFPSEIAGSRLDIGAPIRFDLR